MKKFGKMIKGILKIWFFYLIVCLVIPPLYHKRADEENRECENRVDYQCGRKWCKSFWMYGLFESEERCETNRKLKLKSRQVAPDGTIIDGENYQIIEQSVEKRIFYGILRILIIPFRHLL